MACPNDVMIGDYSCSFMSYLGTLYPVVEQHVFESKTFDCSDPWPPHQSNHPTGYSSPCGNYPSRLPEVFTQKNATSAQ